MLVVGCGRRRERDAKLTVRKGIRFQVWRASGRSGGARSLIFQGVAVLLDHRSVEDLLPPQDGRRAEGLDVFPIGRADQHRDEPDNHWVFSQPIGFRGLQPSCKARGLAGRLTALALGFGAPQSSAVRPGAECLVGFVSVVGAEGLTARSAFSL